MQLTLALEIALRLTFSRQQQRFTRWVAMIAMLGLALGVASLITVMSVMNGLANELRGRLLSAIPHAEITATEGSAALSALDPTVLTQLDAISDAHFFHRTPIMINGLFGNRGAVLSGVPVTTDAYRGPEVQVVSGALLDLATPFTVALGEPLASSLGLAVGDEVSVVMPTASLTPFGLMPRYRKLTVGAIISVGASIESTLALVSSSTATRLSGRADFDGLRVYAKHPEEVNAWLRVLESSLPNGYVVTTWADTNRALFRAIRMEKITVALLLAAVILVAAFNIVSTLTMSVTEKRTDIAAMRVMGLSSPMVERIFLYHGLLLAIVGILLGVFTGLALANYLETVVQWLQTVLGWTLFDPNIYYIGGLPVAIFMTDVLWAVLGALGLSVVASVYPARRASRIQPSEALGGVS